MGKMNFDVAIIGAGPAGLQTAELLKARGMRIVLLEKGTDVASFFRAFPRQRNMISINKVHTGLDNAEARLRFDWNSLLGKEAPLVTQQSRRYFPTADEYVRYLESFAERLSDVIETGCDVTQIRKSEGGYQVTARDGRDWQAAQVVVSTGVSLPWVPDVPGFDEVELYHDYDAAPERFRNKRVLILGKGNSAFETAQSLLDEAQAIHVMSPNPIKLAWNTHFVGHLRAVNTQFLDTYQLKSQNAAIDATPTRIERTDDGLQVTAQMTAAQGHQIELTYDHVIACTGFRFDASIFAEDLAPEMMHMGKFPAMSSQWESTAAPGVWFAGTIMQCRDFKKTMSGFVHGFRHNIVALCDFIVARARGGALTSDVVELAPDVLAGDMIERFSVNAPLFLQPGFLADVIRVDGPVPGLRHAAVPLDWAREALLVQGRHLTMTMEFGDFGANPMHVERQHTAFGGEPDPFIHPVLRLWEDGAVVAQMHLSDHLDLDWRGPAARGPGVGTVTRMTYVDQGGALPPSEVAYRQVVSFLREVLPSVAVETAAE